MSIEAAAKASQTYDLGPVEQIPIGEGRLLRIGRVPVAVFRARDGSLFATQALCPHMGGPLADGIIGAGQLQCPLHGYKFELGSGKPLGNDCKSLKTYQVEITDQNHIRIALGRGEHQTSQGKVEDDIR